MKTSHIKDHPLSRIYFLGIDFSGTNWEVVAYRQLLNENNEAIAGVIF